MKVILREKIPDLGEKWQLVEVANGYGRNYLIPKKLAFAATKANFKLMEDQRKRAELKAGKDKVKAEELAERIAGVKLTLMKKAGEEGVLFGSITSRDIAEALSKEGIEVDRRKIVIDEPIKKTGTHQVRVKLHTEVEQAIEIEVLPEEG
jgi:large subunit ribosomal protein L9